MVCLIVASSGVTAQVKNYEQQSRSSIQEFLVKAAKAHHITNTLKKSVNEELLTGLDISYNTEGEWILGSQADIMYEGGKMKTLTVKGLEDSEWVIIERTTNTYENGLLIQELNEFSDGEVLSPDERYSYSYEPGTNPAIISEILYEYWSEEWVQEYRDVYTVENNQITEGIIYSYNGEEWEKIESFDIEEVNDTTYVTSSWHTGGASATYQREVYPGLSINELYEITFNNNVLNQVPFMLINFQVPDYHLQVWNGEEWENDQAQLTSYYTDQNQQPESKYINVNYYIDGEWVPRSSLVFHYNGKTSPDSSIISYYSFEAENPEWRVYGKEFYTYNGNDLYDEITSFYAPLGELMGMYKYKFEWNGVSTGIEDPKKPSAFKLNPAYPNPFNPTTNITYSLEQPGTVKINVYDMLGRRVAALVNGVQTVGDHQVQFNAAQFSSGLYIVRMETAGFSKTQKITLLK